MKSQELTAQDFYTSGWARALFNPLVGDSMLELGNKVKVSGRSKKEEMVYKHVFEQLGFRHVSVDMNGKNGALPLDLRKPLNLGTFDMVTNIGTSEHVSDSNYDGQIACWRNIVEAMHIGSVMVSITPLEGSVKWLHHGRWYPRPVFFHELAHLNGLEAERVYADGNQVYARLKRIEDVDFQMPKNGIYRNPLTLRLTGDNL